MVQRRDIVLCIILFVLTCGLYGIYWYICLANDVNNIAEVRDTSGGVVFLLTLFTCGIYGLYWAYRCGEKIDIAKRNHGIAAGNGGILFLLLYIFGGVIAYAVIQHEINNLV